MAAYPMSSVYAKWRAHMLFAAALVLMPCFALALVLGLCLRHLRREERAWAVLSARVQRQRAVEAAQNETLRLQALGKLVGAVAHDFNNLLMSLSANVELGKRLNVANFQPQLGAMERAIHRGAALTRRLLGVARKQPLRNETLLLQAWGKDFGLVRASLPSRIELRVDIPGDAWAVEADPAEFELAILNIALNARDAISEEGWFSIAARNVTLDNTSTLPLKGEFLCVTLADNGTGMSPEVLRHAFEPLFTTKPMGEGTGLGLAHVRAFCDQAGGAVELASEVGKGTTLKLYLPRVSRMPAARAADVASVPECDAPSLSILLVEDNDEVAAAEEAVLQVLGHTVHREPEAGSALARLQERVPFDCVVSDIQMPGEMNGIDLARTVRTDFPHLPVVLVTGYAEELERAWQSGFTVLPKPFSIDALKQTLARAAGARSARAGAVPGAVRFS
jgi:signal transduction histidine kinase/CheY-like chemotaxis protein